MGGELIYLEIREALKSSGECFLCTLEGGLEREYVEHYLYELVMDPPSRAAIVASRGFCNHHFYAMLSEAGKAKTTDGLGMALVMESVNKALMEDIEAHLKNLKDIEKSEELSLSRIRLLVTSFRQHLTHSKGEGHSLLKEEVQQMLHSRAHCPACRHVDLFMKFYVNAFVDALNERDRRIVELFKASKGLCIPHYAAVMCSLDEKLPDLRKGPIAREIIDVQLKNIDRLNSELHEFIRKHDYRFSKEPWGKERDVVPRGVAKLSGKQGVRTMLEFGKETTSVVEGQSEPSSIDPASLDRVGEMVRLKAENEYLKSRNDELKRELPKKDSDYCALHFEASQYFEDNKTMTIQLSGLRAENLRFRAILEKHRLIQPSEAGREIGRDDELREKYLFWSRKAKS